MAEDRTTASLGESRGWSGVVVGPYRLLSVLGEGGFGQVWLAEQTEPVERRVALKVIRPGVDPQKVLARFEAEGQALAMMDHPGLARVLEAGVTPDGLPFFALEYVRGPSITEFCDAEGLGVEERVGLMARVCEAVHHAHMKGVVHRDLKPGNVLVERIDGRAMPKVIDFGIAKSLHRRLTDRPLHTEAGQVLGTPEYMSPEQARGDADVDTRADVYSLGAILYELLTGTTPIDGLRTKQEGLGAILRQIEEAEPQKPSTRVGTRGESLGAGGGDGAVGSGSAGGSRRGPGPRVDPATLSRRLRGELDWIVMRCLEKERSRRYDSAAALGRDLERFLQGEAVEAGPPSATYRVRKFVGRNRALVGTIAAAFVVLVVATAVTGWGLAAATAARQESERARAMAEDARLRAEEDRATAVRERARAESESADAVRARDEAEAVTSFLARMLESVEPEEQGRDVTVRAVLDASAAGLAEEFGSRPLVEARLHRTIGNAYRGLGLVGGAERHLELALAIYRGEAGEADSRTLDAMQQLAGFRQEQGRYEEAAALGERLLAILEARGLGQGRIAAGAMNNLALTYADLGRSGEAAAMMERAVEQLASEFGAGHEYTLGSMSNLSYMLQEAGEFGRAEEILRRSVEGWTQGHGAEHPGTLLAKSNLAGLEVDLGRAEEGARLYREVYEARVRVLGEDHPDTIRARINVGWSLDRLGRRSEAVVEYLDAWERGSRVLGAGHPDVLQAALNLAETYQAMGWPEESVRHMPGVCAALREVIRREDATAFELNSCAWILLNIEPVSLRDDRGALEAAERACRMERAAGEGGGAGPALWEYLDTLALARFRVGDAAGAASAQREAIERTPEHQRARFADEMRGRLEEYEAAPGAGGG